MKVRQKGSELKRSNADTSDVPARHGLRVRTVILLLLLVAVVPSFLVHTGIYLYWVDAARDNQTRSNTMLARTLGAALESYVMDLAQHEATLEAAIAGKWPYTSHELDSFLLAAAKDYPALNAFILFGRDGNALAGSDPRIKSVNISDREYFREAIRTRGWILSDLLEGRADPNPIIIVARPVYRGDELLGVLVGSINPDALGKATIPPDSSTTVMVSFFDRKGILVYRSPGRPIPWEVRRKPEGGNLLPAALQGQEALGTIYIAGDDQVRLASRVPVKQLGWVAGVSRRTSEVYAPALRSFATAGGITLAVLAVSVLGAALISRRLVRGMNELGAHARAVGHGHWGQQVNVSGIRELSDLASAFNQMTALRRQAEGALRLSEEKLRQAAADLARSNLDLEQFAYIASHDLQEPLRMISGHMDIVRTELAGKLDLRCSQSMDFAIDGATRMQAMIRDLLTYSRTGRAMEGFQDVDMIKVLTVALANLSAVIAETQAVIRQDPLPCVKAEPPQMVQLFQNLLSNALKYRRTDVRPEVHISARRDEAAWVFQVQDNGIGIPADQQEAIFGLFHRLHGRDEYPGTGIGLAICKRIIQYHCGRIWAQSTPGEGSSFFFTIPDRVGQGQ